MFKKIISILLALPLFPCAATYAADQNKMTLDEKIGQMICLDFGVWDENGSIDGSETAARKPVTEINDEIREIIGKYHVGSVVLFAKNFVDKDQAKKLISDLQKAATDAGNPPLIIMVDQEGGLVERFSFNRERFKNNADVKTSDEAFEKGKAIAKELKELGINCNLAPVVDVNSNPKNPVINVRSFGDNPDTVAEFGEKFLQGMHSQNIMGTAKHFPGHGDTSVDSHFDLPVVNKTFEELNNLELVPFKRLINSGIDMVMTAHIALPKIEKKTAISEKDGKKIFLPATLSKIFLTNLLREQLGFTGVVITDSMVMKAISENFGNLDASKMAINAGADILAMPVVLHSKCDESKLQSLIEYLKTSVNKGEIKEERINQSLERILKLKDNCCA